MKSYLTILFCFFWFGAISSDTSLYRLIINEYPIFNIVIDGQGRIFFSDKSGVKTIENFQIRNFDSAYKGDLLVERGELVYAENESGKGWEKRKKFRENQPLEWLNFLPGDESKSLFSVASSNNLLHYVATGTKIYVFRTENRFIRSLKGYSTRKIFKQNDQLLVSTYSGLFINGKIFDSSNRGGPFLESENQRLGGSKNILRFYSKLEDSVSIDSIDLTLFFDQQDVYIIALEKFKELYWIGTNLGLLVMKKDGSVEVKLPNQVIESFVLDGQTLFICSSNGIYKVGTDLNIENTDVISNWVNHFLILKDKWLLATNLGLFEYHLENKRIRKVKLLESSIVINAIVSDANNYIWVSTDKGLFRKNPIEYSFWYYCQDVEFNKRSFYKSQDSIYFGSINGVFAFDPLNFNFNKKNSFEYFENDSKNFLFHFLVGGITISILLIGLTFYYLKTIKAKWKDEDFNSLDPIVLKYRCEELIRKNLSTITVDSLSEQLGISKRMLFRKLELAGLKPGEIIRSIRKEILLKILKENPNLSVFDLSSLIGYSEKHLIKIIKEFKTDGKKMYK